MSYVIVVPYVHKPSKDRMMATLASELASEVHLINNSGTPNLGAAGSRNLGARLVLQQGADWHIEVSPATRFGPTGGVDFLNQLEQHPDAWVVQCSAPVNWHVIAWHRRLYEAVGLWDENFWPIYGEDGDMSRRIHLATAEQPGTWACVDIDAWMIGYGHSVRLGGVKPDHEMLWRYYRAKWGGSHGAEHYTLPFNNPRNGLDYWPQADEPLSIINELHA